MNIKVLYVFLMLVLTSCIPEIVKQNGKNYSILDWEGGKFIYITYVWSGGKYEDAVELYAKMDKLKKDRGLDELALGRFLSGKVWQVGFIAKEPVNIDNINGHELEQENLESGKYASFKVLGYPENLYLFWNQLKSWLIKDGYKVQSPVYEIYRDDTFNNNIPPEKRNGELRYKVSE